MKKIDIVCIIDDDPISVLLAKKAIELGDICHSFMVYNNGKIAFDNLKAIIKEGNNLPDLILLDLNMPIWDGWNFLDEFTKIKLDKQITIFIISSSNDPEDIRKAEKYSVVSNFIVKPISMMKLKDSLNNFQNN